MEGALILVLLLLVLTLAIVGRYQNGKNKRKDAPRPRERLYVVPQRYDEASSRSNEDRTILQGSAFVIDGDTIVIQKTQIRLFGVDAPELDHPYGKKAKWALVMLCKGQTVRAEVTDIDGHGRTVAKCYLQDGSDLSAEMVKQGLAIDWPKFSDGRYRALEVPDARKKLWLADARQKGRMHLWEKFEEKRTSRKTVD